MHALFLDCNDKIYEFAVNLRTVNEGLKLIKVLKAYANTNDALKSLKSQKNPLR